MASRTVIAWAGVALGAAGIVLAAQGAPSKKPVARRYINLPGRIPNAPYSDAVLAGDTLYLAGNIGFDAKAGKPPEDVEQEARNMLEHFKSALAETNMTMDDIVWVQVFCPDLALYDKFNGVYRTYFKGDFPPRAFIGSGPLLRGGHFEMNAIAVRR